MMKYSGESICFRCQTKDCDGCLLEPIARMIVKDYCPTVQRDTSTDTQTTTYGFGKWIEKVDDGYHGGGYTECSVCGQRYSWGGYFEANEFRYCPRCGHRMEVRE